MGGLVVSDVQAVADRQGGLESRNAAANPRTDVEHVLALDHGDTEQDSRFSVVVEGRLRRVYITAGHTRDVSQIDDPLRLRNLDREILDFANALDVTTRCDDQLASTGVDRAARKHDVLRLQRRPDLAGRDAQLRNPGGGELDPDRLLLDTVELNAADTGNQIEFILDLLCFFVHLGERESLGYESHAHHRYIAVVVVDEWTDYALGQTRHHVDDLVSNVFPDLVEVAVLISDVDVDLRAALPRIRIDGVPLGDPREGLLDFAGDEAFDLFRRHAGGVGGHDGLAHQDRRILLARKARHHRQTESRESADDDHHQRGVAKRESSEVHRRPTALASVSPPGHPAGTTHPQSR